MKVFLFSLFAFLMSFPSFGQSKILLLQSHRYSKEIAASSSHYYYISGHYIDPQKKGEINFDVLQAGINKLIKDVDYDGLIVLNIENKIYQELKKNSIHDRNYKKNVDLLVKMVLLVKKLRPQAKVSIYNIPYMFNSNDQRSRSDYAKLYPLLKVLDVFAPSLYLHYSGFQRGDSYFNNFIKSNLDLSFSYAEKLNKKVYPFVWYKIHPANRFFGGSVVSADLYKKYLRIIKDYTYKGKKVEKLIYWESSNETLDINQKAFETLENLKQ